MKAIDGHEVEFVRRESHGELTPFGRCDVFSVIYRWRGRLWRCSEKEWQRYTKGAKE